MRRLGPQVTLAKLGAPGGAALIGTGAGDTVASVLALDLPRAKVDPAFSAAQNSAAIIAAAQAAADRQTIFVITVAGVINCDPIGELPYGCKGFSGLPGGRTTLRFNTTQNCISLRGGLTRVRDVRIQNMDETARGAETHVLELTNAHYGYYENLWIDSGAAGGVGLKVAQRYDASIEEDRFLIAHLGVWYNTFVNVTSNYLGVGSNIGTGIKLVVDASAVNVVNPPGQQAGTFSGSVEYNQFVNVNAESLDRCIDITERASNNLFTGGQLLGGNYQIWCAGQHNRTFNAKLNQAAIEPIHCTADARRNEFDMLVFPGGAALDVIGDLGPADNWNMVRHRGDGILTAQRIASNVETFGVVENVSDPAVPPLLIENNLMRFRGNGGFPTAIEIDNKNAGVGEQRFRWASNGGQMSLFAVDERDGTLKHELIKVQHDGRVILKAALLQFVGLRTSNAGLGSGELWVDGTGTVKMVT